MTSAAVPSAAGWAGGSPARRLLAAVDPRLGGRRAREWALDALVLLAGAASWLWVVEVDGPLLAQLPAWWSGLDLVVGAVAVVALLWRHRHPQVLALLMAPVGGFFLTAGLPALVSVYTVAARSRPAVALLATGVHLVIAVPYWFLLPDAGMDFGVWTVVMLLLYACALSLGAAVRSRRQVIQNLMAEADRERAGYEQRLGRARQAEREQIAREMHDVLAHRISLLSVHAGALEYRARAQGAAALTGEELQQAAGVIRESAYRALEELREVLTLLPEDGDDGGVLGTARPAVGLAGVASLVEEVTASGQQVELRVAPSADELGAVRPQLQRTAYRVVQEGLTNARKHTPGARVRVVVERAADRLRVQVVNPLPVGATATEIPGAGAGLAGLSERVRLDGGALRHGVRDGCFELEAVLPWRS
ncbi:histidine kinase [Auraticoccus sp. F435]|uniref:histidine kinase n=1 Tax=Auraticoccus cholistanensis TaxID=2656650 RepID=A0A6A9USL0_9ACTN|nr:histidine kinase [Auraticoccus cholistanensis]MVA74672.1 histidine kinase [Auraticoccus cholistanensis]